MPLRDHFRPPLSLRRHWHAFHNAWATYIAADLNRRLPAGYFAEPNVQFGIEVDVAAFEEGPPELSQLFSPGEDAPLFHPTAPQYTLPFTLAPDTVEVTIFTNDAGPTLAGAIELVSPANKDRPSHHRAFVSKCETYLQQGVGLIVVDVVTGRSTNLHDEFLAHLTAPEALYLHADLYTVAYRLVQRQGQAHLEIWQESLAIGDILPTMPLWLRGAVCCPVVLDETYARTCHEQRLTSNGP
jgi:hypothetical protein